MASYFPSLTRKIHKKEKLRAEGKHSCDKLPCNTCITELVKKNCVGSTNYLRDLSGCLDNHNMGQTLSYLRNNTLQVTHGKCEFRIKVTRSKKIWHIELIKLVEPGK